MDCEDICKALSARLDGEESGIDDDVVEAHLSACRSCRQFYERAAALKRSMAFDPQPESGLVAPDLSAAILADVEPRLRRVYAQRLMSMALSRIGLVLAAVCFIVWAVRLLGHSGALVVASAAQHADVSTLGADPLLPSLLVDAAAVRLALAVALLLTAWRPILAAGLFPVMCGLCVFTIGFSARDAILGVIGSGDIMGIGLFIFATVLVGWTWLADGIGVLAMSRAWKSALGRPGQ